MPRIFLLMLVLGAAVGVPYVSTEWSKIKTRFTGGGGAATETAAAAPGKPQVPVIIEGQGPLGFPGPGASNQTPIVDMAQAFRFNVTPPEIIARWPRVSSGLVEERLYGMRVPLITGMGYDDLAGALTYYFTPSQRCAKIAFSGTTGDPRRLITLVTDRFGFQPFNSGEAGVVRYQIRWNGKAHSELVIRPAAVLRSSAPNSRYDVQLSVVEPGAM